MDRRYSGGMPMKWSRLWLFILALAYGCTPRATPPDLYGKWELQQNGARQVLQLNVYARFTHELISNGIRTIAVGEWELTDVDRAPRVLLRYHRDFDGHSSGASLNVVRRWNGKTACRPTPTGGRCFQRCKPPVASATGGDRCADVGPLLIGRPGHRLGHAPAPELELVHLRA